MISSDLRKIISLLEPLDSAPVECDGMSRLVATVLAEAGIPYQARLGSVAVGSRGFAPHFWIETGPYRIDYRARMWLGDTSDVPHGVFLPKDFPGAEYAGSPVLLEPLPSWLFEIMCTPIPSDLLA